MAEGSQPHTQSNTTGTDGEVSSPPLVPESFEFLEPGKELPGEWMPSPSSPILGCPPGLECLSLLEKINVFGETTSILNQNRSRITNQAGDQIFYAFPENRMFRQLGNMGYLKVYVVNKRQEEVMRVDWELEYCTGCCWCVACCNCSAIKFRVESPPGQTIGYIVQSGSCWKQNFSILDASRQKVLEIRGPCCFRPGLCCTCDIDFNLYAPNSGRRIGKIVNKWAGRKQEWYTNADNYVIKFPKDLDVKVKACILGALFFFDHNFLGKPLLAMQADSASEISGAVGDFASSMVGILG